MRLSHHNVTGKLHETDTYFIANFLSRQADLIDRETAEKIKDDNFLQDETFPYREEFIERGYIVDGDEEDLRFRQGYIDFIENRDNDEKQLFFVPRYSCNFSCTYCYQEDYLYADTPGASAEGNNGIREVIQAFFSYIDQKFARDRKYITVFGGEPLLPDKTGREALEEILAGASVRNLAVAIVTNGYHLDTCVELFKGKNIREIQVTLDGAEAMHNARRPLKGGGPTFERIVKGVDLVLEAGIPVNLRMVLDRQNIHDLPELSRFAINKGWTANPLFKTQLGRNYELHTCQPDREKLFDRIGLYKAVYFLIRGNPEITEFHKPAFSISKFLFENGEMPEPLYDSCPGVKTEWAFDHTGSIFSCTATVGKPGEALGTFYPRAAEKDDLIEQWEERDILSIPECGECPVRLACGGGCAAAAKNRTGRIHAPDCRPVQPLMELGFAHYFGEN